MIALVTGANGFLGSALVTALAARGHEVIAAVRKPGSIDAQRGVREAVFDLSNGDAEWKAILAPADVIYHLAWSSLPATSDIDPVGDASENIVGAVRMLKALEDRDGVRFVFASSGGTVYGEMTGPTALESQVTAPISAYGMSKLAVEGYLGLFGRLRGLDHVSLRIANPFGPRQTGTRNFGAIATFARRGLNGEPITIWGDGRTVRDYVYLDDVVDALLAAGEKRGGPRILNVGSGVGRSLNDLIAAIESEIGRPLDVRYEKARGFDIGANVLDTRLAIQALGWRAATPFAEGLACLVSALR